MVITFILGRYIVMEDYRSKRHKKFHRNMERMDLEKKIKKEVNSISPLFNGMTGLEVREMMEKEYKNK